MTHLLVTIPGLPVPQGRARTGGGHHHMPKASRVWRAVAVDAIGYAKVRARLATLDELVCVDVAIIMPRVGSRPRLVSAALWSAGSRTPAGCKGDADNFAKAALDALVDAAVLRDDHLVTDLHVCKRYAAVGEGACVEIVVRGLVAL